MLRAFFVFTLFLALFECHKISVLHAVKEMTAEEMLPFIKQASKEGSEMIVLPEIVTAQTKFEAEYIVENKRVKKDKTKPIQSVLSAAARKYKIYIVVGMIELGEYCQLSECVLAETMAEVATQVTGEHSNPAGYCSTGRVEYNVAVVFNRKGVVIKKYRKENVFMFQMFKKGDPNTIYFDTDFGERFGIFLCFDILHETPTLEIVQDLNIKNVIFPTWWVDLEYPFTALAVQQGFSKAHDVNLFAANLMYDSVDASSGSGIYFSGFPANVTSVDTAKILSAEFGQVETNREFNTDMTIRSFYPMPYTIPQEESSQVNGSVTKEFFFDSGFYGSITIDSPSENEYFKFSCGEFLVFGTVVADACGIYNCGEEDNCSPSEMLNVEPQSLLQSAKVIVEFPKETFTGQVIPSLTTSYLMVPPSSDFEFTKTEDDENVIFTLDYNGDSGEPVSSIYLIRTYNNPYWPY